jgi:hypothetical protein
MIMPSSWFNDLMSSDQLRTLARCPVCHSQNDFQEVKVIKEKLPEVLLMHRCPKCQSNVLFCLISEPWGLGSVGLVTDLDTEEIEHYLISNHDLNENTILDYYKLIQKNHNFLLEKVINKF